jgi:hypothetical protein
MCFIEGAGSPDRTNRVKNKLGRQTICFCDFDLSDLAAIEFSTFIGKLRTGGPMDSAIDPTTSQ